MLDQIIDCMMASILEVVIITIKVVVGIIGALARGGEDEDR